MRNGKTVNSFNLRRSLVYALIRADEALLDRIAAQTTRFAQARLGPRPSKKVSEERSRDALGLMGLTTRKLSLNSLTSWL